MREKPHYQYDSPELLVTLAVGQSQVQQRTAVLDPERILRRLEGHEGFEHLLDEVIRLASRATKHETNGSASQEKDKSVQDCLALDCVTYCNGNYKIG